MSSKRVRRVRFFRRLFRVFEGVPLWGGLLAIALLPLLLPACDIGQDQPPEVDFTISNDTPRAGEEVTFTSEATDPEGEIEEYIWTFEEGDIDYATHFPEDTLGPDVATVTQVFPGKGEYTAELEVRDGIGTTRSEKKTLDVQQRYNEVTTTELELRKLPNPDSGELWADDSDPDLYYVVVHSSDTLFTSPLHEDFDHSNLDGAGTVSLPGLDVDNVYLTDFTGNYTIAFFDADADTDDDFVDDVSFSFADHVACNENASLCYPPLKEVPPRPGDDDSTIFNLHLSWRLEV